MTTSAHDPGASDFETLAQQYFSAWGDALRHASGTGPAQGQAQASWQRLFEGWAQLVPQQGSGAGEEAVNRFREQAGDWYGTMQDVASRFAGRDASSADVANAWREAVQAKGDGMLGWMLQGARGSSSGAEPMPDLLAMLQQWQQLAGPWAQSPAFGPGREHQARWQALLRAQEEYRVHSQAYVAQIKQALDDAFALFEQRLAEHEQPGSQLTSARAMFDLWIEVAEEAYAKVALSEPFQEVYAAMGNAQMRLRAGVQREVEQVCERIGLPTRSEMDAAHKRIAELERGLRRLQAVVEGRAASRRGPPPAEKAAVKPAAAGKAAAKKAVARKPVARKAAAKKAPPPPAPAKKPAPKKAPRRQGAAAMKGPLGFNAQDLVEEGLAMQRKLMEGLKLLPQVEDVDYGVTAREEVWRDGKVVLYRFVGDAPAAPRPPLLIVYALVNRPYMVDLQQDRSLVQKLLALGQDVYVLDWGYPDRSERYQTLEDYLLRYIDGAVDALRERSGGPVDLLGICQGGVFALCYAALRRPKLGRLITMVTPVDFHTADNMLSHWARQVDVDLLVDTLGNIPADLMNASYLMLKPFRLNVQKYVGLLDILDDKAALEDFLRMEKWIFDSPDLAGEAFRDFITQFYQGNGLVNGTVRIGEEAVDLGQVTLPVLNLYAEHDHLVPPDASRAMRGRLGTGDYTESSFRGGHIGIYVSGRAQREVPATIDGWLRARDA